MHGVIYDPYRNETFTAWKGQGAYLNGEKITCCATNDLMDAVVCTGSQFLFLLPITPSLPFPSVYWMRVGR